MEWCRRRGHGKWWPPLAVPSVTLSLCSLNRTDLPPAHKPAPPPPKKKNSDMKGHLTSDDIQVRIRRPSPSGKTAAVLSVIITSCWKSARGDVTKGADSSPKLVTTPQSAVLPCFFLLFLTWNFHHWSKLRRRL